MSTQRLLCGCSFTSLFTIAKEMETTLMSINCGMDKQSVVHPNGAILFSNKKKRALDAHNKMGDTENLYAESEKPELKMVRMYDSIHTKF